MLYLKNPNQAKSFVGGCLRSFHQRIINSIWMLTSGEGARAGSGYSRINSLIPNGKAIIICNGPSLSLSDKEVYGKYPLVGLNFGSLSLPDLASSFVFHFVGDHLVVKQNIDRLLALQGIVFLDLAMRKYRDKCTNALFYSCGPDQLPYAAQSLLLPSFGNSTSFAAQILFLAGVRQVALIGLDHDYGSIKPLEILPSSAFVSAYNNSCILQSDKSYQAPDLLRVEYHLRNIGAMFADHGGFLVNCSEKSSLQSLPRMKLHEFDML
jgi:hypothetical protein